MKDIIGLSRSLSKASLKRYSNAFSIFEWPEGFGEEERFFPDHLISLNGTAAYEFMDENTIKSLGFHELINFFSLNIHGEKFLLAGMSDRLYRKFDPEVSRYMHHFIDEENKHMSLFGNFCTRYHRVYPDKKMSAPPQHERKMDSLLFFSKVVIFEELVDRYNLAIANDDRLNGLVRAINQYHHDDEVRHLAFGRRIVADLFGEYRNQYSESDLAFIDGYLRDYFDATLREYYNPSVYRDAGLEQAFDLYQSATESDAFRRHRDQLAGDCLAFFKKEGILRDQPSETA